jgi:hypothetical protein
VVPEPEGDADADHQAAVLEVFAGPGRPDGG